MSWYPFNPSGLEIQGEPPGAKADQAFIAHYASAPAAGSNTAVHAAITTTTSQQVITTGIVQPDVARVVTVTGNQAGAAEAIVIAGTDIAGNAITETITASGTTTVAGTKAFAHVASITVPAQTQAGDTISVGTNKSVGLPHRLAYATLVLLKLLNGSADGGTVTANASEVAKNVYAVSGTLNGTNAVDLYYLV